MVNLYIPPMRNHNHRSVVYVIVGDHCQPIVDTNVIRTIVHSACTGIRSLENLSHVQRVGDRQETTCRKLGRSVDKLYAVQEEVGLRQQLQSEDRSTQQQTLDVEMEDWLEEEDAERNKQQLRKQLHPLPPGGIK